MQRLLMSQVYINDDSVQPLLARFVLVCLLGSLCTHEVAGTV